MAVISGRSWAVMVCCISSLVVLSRIFASSARISPMSALLLSIFSKCVGSVNDCDARFRCRFCCFSICSASNCSVIRSSSDVSCLSTYIFGDWIRAEDNSALKLSTLDCKLLIVLSCICIRLCSRSYNCTSINRNVYREVLCVFHLGNNNRNVSPLVFVRIAQVCHAPFVTTHESHRSVRSL